MTPLEADCLLAVAGLTPGAFTAAQRRQAMALPELFRARALAWWTADRKPFVEVKSPDLDKLFDAITTDVPRVALESWMRAGGDDPDYVLDLQIGITRARQYLVAQWPRITLQTYAGPRLMPLAIDDEAEVVSLWAVLDEPTRILDEMDAGTLTSSQANAFRNVYPALHAHYMSALQEGAAASVAADPDWMPDEAQELILSMLTGRPIGALPPTDAAASPAEAPSPSKDLGAGKAATQADKSSAPKSPK